MSTPPRRVLAGGTMEYGQNMVIQKILSAHNLQEQERRRARQRQQRATSPLHLNPHPHHQPAETGMANGSGSETSSHRYVGRARNTNASRGGGSSSTSYLVPPSVSNSLRNATTATERDPLLQVEAGSPNPQSELPESEARKVFRYLQHQQQQRKKSSEAEEYYVGTSTGTTTGTESPPLSSSINNSSHSLSSLWAMSSSQQTMQQQQQGMIRFQVLVWNIGALDVVQGRVPVTFRVTIFWNDTLSLRNDDCYGSGGTADDNDSCSVGPSRLWVMQGRQKAVPVRESRDEAAGGGQCIDVPPVSILNVVTFDTIGPPEVCLLRQDTGLWQWTCMYRATLIQDHWDVHNFPHDEHDICLKLAVLAHRKVDSRWDRRYWQLGLATESDSMGCVRVPHGLLAGELSIPEFEHEPDLKFDFDALDIGPGGGCGSSHMVERCLTVSLRVRRSSYYYDRNIVPLLGMLNLVAITITALGADEFFQRGLLTLNIAFVEVNIRMATDKHLPSVPYQIKIQRVLNEYFYGLLFLVLESNLVFELHRYGYTRITGPIDFLAALVVTIHNIWTVYDYYVVSRRHK